MNRFLQINLYAYVLIQAPELPFSRSLSGGWSRAVGHCAAARPDKAGGTMHMAPPQLFDLEVHDSGPLRKGYHHSYPAQYQLA